MSLSRVVLDIDNEEQEKEFELRKFNYNSMLEEVAIHEASHFVFGILVRRIEPEYTEIYSLRVDVDKHIAVGHTNGILPPVGENELKEADNWFRADRIRIIARFFSTLVGYATYKSFFSDVEYFIGYRTGFPQNRDEVYYYNLKSALSNNPYNKEPKYCDIMDYYIINKYFKLLEINNESQKLELCELAISYLLVFLKKRAIKNSIWVVKNILRKNNGNTIEGDELKKIYIEVEEITKKISLEKLIKKFENHI